MPEMPRMEARAVERPAWEDEESRLIATLSAKDLGPEPSFEAWLEQHSQV